ncbi:F-box protein PP2-A15 [Striga hermonthica]|uniref:F-box protein PP2-A15 n=1 Tax=Striga hermonthica TaxID=68872 RepID=A0A9N7RHG9_STRHE|nr:F-box protein PP2-A15 [Striga hermonthica]
MGASLSNLTENGPSNGGPGLGDIPESCVACVFLYLSPPEICNLARLNRAFRGAASSDAVWETKLPPNYLQLLDLLARPDVHQSLRKKDIFAILSRPLPFDDGNKVVWVDKFTGRVCMSVSAKAMAITGIEDRRYWNWVPTEESRFSVVAYLQQIWWFEVDGTVKFPLPPDLYTLSFRIHLGRFSRRLGRRVSSFKHTHGWDIKPVRFEFSTSDGQQASSECLLDEPQQDDGDSSSNNSNSNSYYTSHKRGCWIDYKVGEFTVRQSDCETEVRFSMKQIDCTHSKGGLCVDSVSIIPVELKGRRGRGVLK